MKHQNGNPQEAHRELKAWIDGNANYNEGVKLFVKHGGDKGLAARTFMPKGACAANKRLLLFHIKKMIKDFESLGVQVMDSTKSQPANTNQNEGGGQNGGGNKVDLPAVGLRKLYPNIKLEECPDAIKLMFVDSLALWNTLCKAHDTELADAETDDERLEAMTKIFKAKEDNKLVHAELLHYNNTGNILGKHPKLEAIAYEIEMTNLKVSNGAKLQKERDKCYNNFARHEKDLKDGDFKDKAEKEGYVKKWKTKVDICDNILNAK
jgi:hypothetical protein